jgi:hypothetical protein
VYSLGIILYQVLVADFTRSLAPSWEDEIADPILRGVIANATCDDPAKRLPSAAVLAERLSALAESSQEVEIREPEVPSFKLEDQLATSHTFRPWVAGLMVALAAGLVFSVLQYRRAVGERNSADRQFAITEAMNAFLSHDLLGRSDPLDGSKSDVALLDAIHRAIPDIDKEFQNEPLIEARLHQTLARISDDHNDFPDARGQYVRAAELFTKTEGDLSQNGIIVQLQRAAFEARSSEAGNLQLAKSIAEQQRTRIRQLTGPRPELQVWNALARAEIALGDNDPRSAAKLFEETIETTAGLRQFDERDRLQMKQQLALCYLRMGDGANAEKLYKELVTKFTAIEGQDSPNVLRARLSLAQAYLVEKKHADAIQEVTAIYPEFVARLGANHALTMQLLSIRAQSEQDLGIWNDAIRDDQAMKAIAVKNQGPLSSIAIAALSDASIAQCRAGRLQEGTRNARAAFDASLKTFGVHAGLTGGTAHALASCLAALNQLHDASWLLTLVNVPAASQSAGDPDFGAKVKLVQADIAKRQGNEGRLKRLLDEIAPVFTRADAEEYEKHLYASLASAQDSLEQSASLVQSPAVIVAGVKPQ